MKITLADHFGMCFGVRDALRKTHDLATSSLPSGNGLTVLGDLVHNPVVDHDLNALGVQKGHLHDPQSASTKHVVITAHGAADKDRQSWHAAGHQVTDTTCPLVKKAHTALAQLVTAGFHPLIIGKTGHVEVQGLAGDFPHATILLTPEEIATLPFHPRFGVVSQTTQPIDFVQSLVQQIRRRHPAAEVRFIDTVCQPTKDRQTALESLARENEIVIVVGGHHSNNTTQLAQKARSLGATAHHVATADELDPAWFRRATTVGITAGTSTLDETVRQVFDRIQQIAAASSPSLLQKLTANR
jgi:4-hydroxy-3-methylbut-2-enyl diphosphate reductase